MNKYRQLQIQSLANKKEKILKTKRKYIEMPVLFWKNIDSEVKRLNKEVKKGDKKVTAAEVLRRYAKSLGVENEHTK